ncbi:hypothetical protein P5Y53_20120 [Dyella jiangningensis]|uniref:hypothetical protein n=1 Tax=Dyella jiangningensis TaxID=1379159 RepID=UPI0024103BDC|nr:hypothetical protein [Dyella jiangningensis]MDG2539993.1 hypothetical protein [Dyella jiangningensis]
MGSFDFSRRRHRFGHPNKNAPARHRRSLKKCVALFQRGLPAIEMRLRLVARVRLQWRTWPMARDLAIERSPVGRWMTVPAVAGDNLSWSSSLREQAFADR